MYKSCTSKVVYSLVPYYLSTSGVLAPSKLGLTLRRVVERALGDQGPKAPRPRLAPKDLACSRARFSAGRPHSVTCPLRRSGTGR